MHEAFAIHERVASYGVSRTTRETVFDRLVFVAAQLFRVSIAVVALDDGERLWFKAQVGLRLKELPRESAYYTAIIDGSPLIIEDLRLDARFSNCVLVTGPPQIRFYAGAALVTPDHLRVGVVCVADYVPKSLLTRQTYQLAQLARTTITLLEEKRPVVT